jgi:hypothetical protein
LNLTDEKVSKVLLLGDSMIKHVEVKNAEKCVFPEIKAEYLSKKVEDLVQDKDIDLKTIVLHVGTNNLKKASRPEDVMGEVYDLIRTTKRSFPKSGIIVNSIVYRKDVNADFIKMVNKNIRWACNALRVIFCDLSKWLDHLCIGKDGIHLNRKGSFLLSTAIEKIVKICSEKGN